MELSVVIPTFDRRELLLETLRRLDDYAPADTVEVIVVDDGSGDGTPGAVRSFATDARVPVRVVEQERLGPAAARNKGLAAAAGAACLFLGDDIWPTERLVHDHLSFHRERPEREGALLGRVEWAPHLSPSEFMSWCATIHAGYHEIRDPDHVSGAFFFTSNVSAKTALLRQQGGFDDAFKDAAFEDVELGLRLEKAGMRLVYRPEALGYHVHAIDLAGELRRMRVIGEAAAILRARAPEWPEPRRPGARHRIKALALTHLNRTPLQKSLRRRTWTFLCHEAYREAYWGVQPGDGRRLSIGGELADQALLDPASAAASASAR